MVRRLALFSILLTAIAVSRAAAQDVRGEAVAPAHISFVEGLVALERDGRIDEAPANMPLLAGDRLRTRAGRVEILFADGATLHLDHNSAIDLQSDELVRLLDGRIRLSIPSRARDVSYRIDGPHAWAQISQPGDYRAAILQNSAQTELEFAVIRGVAELVNDEGRTTVRAGERAFARANAAPSYTYVFNSYSSDPFDRWSEARRSERLALSTQYLPDEVRPYAATLDHYGSWQYESTYGYVWYPRVAYGWRPYHYGRWSTVGPYGWTWIPADPWGWPTHHYGRWGVSFSGSWFWIPGRSWGPAWVSWGYAPGYVSWCPLGFNNYPVYPIVNVHHGYSAWRGWTVVAQRDFGVGYVNRRSVAGPAINSRTLSSFAQGNSGPTVTGYAVPRGTAAVPIRVAGTTISRPTSSVISVPSTSAVAPSRSTSATGRAGDVTRTRPSADARAGFAAGRERTSPDRPLVRSDRADRSIRSAEPANQYTTPAARVTTPEAAADAGSGWRDSRRNGLERNLPTYGRDAPGRAVSPYQPGERAVPRGIYGTTREASQPDGSAGRPTVDRPSYGMPGAVDRRVPSGAAPSQPVARPGGSPPPSAAPPSGGRGGRSGGDGGGSRGVAVPRSGGRGGR